MRARANSAYEYSGGRTVLMLSRLQLHVRVSKEKIGDLMRIAIVRVKKKEVEEEVSSSKGVPKTRGGGPQEGYRYAGGA